MTDIIPNTPYELLTDPKDSIPYHVRHLKRIRAMLASDGPSISRDGRKLITGPDARAFGWLLHSLHREVLLARGLSQAEIDAEVDALVEGNSTQALQ